MYCHLYHVVYVEIVSMEIEERKLASVADFSRKTTFAILLKSRDSWNRKVFLLLQLIAREENKQFVEKKRLRGLYGGNYLFDRTNEDG